MDFLEHTVEQNPELIETAVELHQRGDIPPNTTVIDLDTVRRNARKIRMAADELDMNLYAMSKQFGRNPLACQAIANEGIGFVAVDIEGVKALHRHGLSVEHVGHLCQVPSEDVPYVVESVDPEVITVFSIQKAREISQAAEDAGTTQDVLLRVVGEKDLFYNYQTGGFPETEIVDAARKIQDLSGVHVAGLTTFPAVRFNIRDREEEVLPNMETLHKAADKLETELGIDVDHLNAPGDTSAAVLKLLNEEDVSHGEPGHGFFGTTPWHYFDESLPERPAWVYVSEISHTFGEKAFAYGGGLMGSDPSYGFWSPLYQQLRMYALVGDNPSALANPDEFVLAEDADFIDYNVPLDVGSQSVEVGDSVVYGFRNQVFVSRSNVAVVDNIHASDPELLGLFDRTGNRIDYHQQPQSLEGTKSLMDKV